MFHLLILVSFLYGSSSKPIYSCSSQAECLDLAFTETYSGLKWQQWEICFFWDSSLGDCRKSGKDTISHACPSDGEKIENWEEGSENAMCETVWCGESATFAIKDGKECYDESLRAAMNAGEGGAIKCYDGEGSDCSGGNTKACNWVIPAPDCVEQTTTTTTTSTTSTTTSTTSTTTTTTTTPPGEETTDPNATSPPAEETTEPSPTEPAPTEPAPTEPAPTEPATTEPETTSTTSSTEPEPTPAAPECECEQVVLDGLNVPQKQEACLGLSECALLEWESDCFCHDCNCGIIQTIFNASMEDAAASEARCNPCSGCSYSSTSGCISAQAGIGNLYVRDPETGLNTNPTFYVAEDREGIFIPTAGIKAFVTENPLRFVLIIVGSVMFCFVLVMVCCCFWREREKRKWILRKGMSSDEEEKTDKETDKETGDAFTP